MDSGDWILLISVAGSIVIGVLGYIAGLRVNRAKARRDNSEANAVEITAFNALVDKVQNLSNELTKVKEELSSLRSTYRTLWQYLLDSLEHMRKHGLKPLPPPRELEDNPELVELMRDTKDKMKPVEVK